MVPCRCLLLLVAALYYTQVEGANIKSPHGTVSVNNERVLFTTFSVPSSDDISTNDQPASGILGATSCNFEINDCGFDQNVAGDVYDWKRNRDYDHTTGYGYSFTINGAGRNPKDNAMFKTDLMKASGGNLRFYIHTADNSKRQKPTKLKIDLLPTGMPRQTFFTYTGPSGDGWVQVDVGIAYYQSFQFLFEGIIGSTGSDITIDDMVWTPY